MLDIQKKLSKPFLALLALPATAVGFALSTQIAALSWILSRANFIFFCSANAGKTRTDFFCKRLKRLVQDSP